MVDELKQLSSQSATTPTPEDETSLVCPRSFPLLSLELLKPTPAPPRLSVPSS